LKTVTRRALGKLAAGSCLAPAAAAGALERRPAARVVVIGGGAGGATVARYLAASARALEVTLVEPKRQYTTCFFSNLYLAGQCSFESLNHGYETLAAQYGIRVIHDRATGIDPVARTVSLAEGASLTYDRLVVAPGIAFRPGAIAGYDEAASLVMPHAWMAGPQTQLLRRRLETMPDGGVFVIVAPPEPFRCPPGPYERASLVAAYFKRHKPRAKILILDAKDSFFEEDLFQEGWNRHYPRMIEWLPAQFIGPIEGVNAHDGTIRTATQTFQAAVANVIPPPSAADLAQRTGLADATGWCPVDPATFESRLHPGIHLVGDAILAGAMPKSAFAANSQAKSCAFAIISALTGAGNAPPFLYNTCYSFLAPDDAVADAISFKTSGGRIEISEIQISPIDESTAARAHGAQEAWGWYDAFTRDIFG
jgi:sulfide dehydrogenase [flavocytochrome c] flavoprotein subunit